MKWYLKITEEEFEYLYPEGDISLFKREPTSDEDFIANFLPNKLWRLNNIYTIVNKFGVRIRFVMNRAQHKVYSASLQHPRIIVLKSRQQGISTFWLISFLDDGIFIDDLNVGLLAQGLEEASTLLERVKLAWDAFPEAVKSFINVRLSKNNSKEYAFNNGSTIFIRTSFRSATLQRLHVSELGKISAKTPEKARELMSGTMQAIKAGNPVVLESTAEGRRNMFYKMWYEAANFVGTRGPKAFKPVFLSWTDDPDCTLAVPQKSTAEDREYFAKVELDLGITLTDEQKWWSSAQRRELPELYDQEYPYSPESAFAAVRDGAYYAQLWKTKGRVVEGLYDQHLDVYVAMDLGMNDTMVLVFWQEYVSTSGLLEIRVVKCYRNSGEGLRHYYEVVRDTRWKIARVYLPHDAKVKELGTSKSRLGILQEMGMKNTTVLPRTNSINNDIEYVRKAIPNIILNGDENSGCEYLEDMFHNYSKQWDDKLGSWKDKPLHDEWSNPADCVRYMVMGRYTSINSGGRVAPKVTKRSYRGANI